MAPTQLRRCLVALVATVMVWIQVALPVSADGSSVFGGRVLAADGSTARSGVTIALLHESDGRVFRSAPSDGRGVFRVDSASPGTYRIVAETAEGAFLAPGRVHLAEGRNPPVALSLQPTEQEAEPEKDSGGDQEDPPDPADPGDPAGDPSEEPPVSEPPPPPKEEGMSTLVKGIVAGIVGLVAIAVVLEITDEEDVGSPF
jgi:hypothetical protein